MEQLPNNMPFDLHTLIHSVGIIGVGIIIFFESGVLLGIFFPGDSLLFTAGVLAAGGYVHFPTLVIVAFVAAVLGDQMGYYTGKKFGPRIFSRPGSKWLNPEHIKRAQDFYEKHGKKTIILSRFVPVVRTLAPIIAGIGLMDRRIFTKYNIVGGALWSIGLSSVGYFLGSIIPSIDKYILPIVIGIVVISSAPVASRLLHKKS